MLPAAQTNSTPSRVGRLNRVLERLRVAAAAPAVAHNLDAGDGQAVLDRVGSAPAVEPEPPELRNLTRHDLHVPVDAGHADPVVADAADRAGAVGAVAVVVEGIVVVVEKSQPWMSST